MVSSIENYPYSSYGEYTENRCDITNISFTLDILSENRSVAIKQFKEFHKIDENENFEITDSQRKSPEQIRRIIMSETSGDEPDKIKEYDRKKRNELIKKLVFEIKISKSALERATGISRGTIIRICNKM